MAQKLNEQAEYVMIIIKSAQLLVKALSSCVGVGKGKDTLNAAAQFVTAMEEVSMAPSSIAAALPVQMICCFA